MEWKAKSVSRERDFLPRTQTSKQAAGDAADEGVGGHGGGSVKPERVDEVQLNAPEDNHSTDADNGGADEGCDPMDRLLGCGWVSMFPELRVASMPCEEVKQASSFAPCRR
ncbi:hypothetical protein PG990_010828 [Apiospora arundinis]